jgi:hypothetical protein
MYQFSSASVPPEIDIGAIEKYLEMISRSTRTNEIAVGLKRRSERYFCSSLSAAQSADSRYQIGCIGRVLNAALILELDAAGLIGIDRQISCYLSELKHTFVGDHVLVRHLLCGTAGYLGYASVRKIDRGLTWTALVERIKSSPVIFRPGEVYSLDYSTYVLLAVIIQRVCSRPWSEAVDELIGVPLFGRRLYESDAETSIWSAAVSNVTLSVDELLVLGHALVHGNASIGASRIFCDNTISHLRNTVVRVPLIAGQTSWLPRGYGFGMAEYHSDVKGLCGRGTAQLSSIRVLPAQDMILSVCVASRNAMVRHTVIDGLLSELGIRREPNVEDMPLPEGMPPEALCGTYVGLRGFEVTVEFERPTICIVMRSEGRPELRVFGRVDERSVVSMAKNSPIVGVAFFVDPATGLPCLMVGVTALRKLG